MECTCTFSSKHFEQSKLSISKKRGTHYSIHGVVCIRSNQFDIQRVKTRIWEHEIGTTANLSKRQHFRKSSKNLHRKVTESWDKEQKRKKTSKLIFPNFGIGVFYTSCFAKHIIKDIKIDSKLDWTFQGDRCQTDFVYEIESLLSK